MNALNSYINKGFAKIKSFPGTTSRGLLHYIEPTLKDESFDTDVINRSVNDLSKDKYIYSLDELVTNLRDKTLKCFLVWNYKSVYKWNSCK